MGSPDDSPFQHYLWLHVCSGNISQVLCTRDSRGRVERLPASPLKCVECQADKDRLAMVSQHCLLPVYPSQDTGGMGSLALRSHWGTIQPCRGGYWKMPCATTPSANFTGVPFLEPRGRGLIPALQQWAKAVGWFLVSQKA